MMKLDEKIAVVTGASRGIGKKVAISMAKNGASVALVARSEEALASIAEQIQTQGGKAIAIPADLSLLTGDGVEEIRSKVMQTFGAPNILVNAAGIFGPFKQIKDGSANEWIMTQQVNTIAPYLFMQSMVNGMIEQGWGRIVNVTSAAALHEPGPLNSAYATSKAALNQVTRHLAAELKGTGVTANVIHPGDVKTDMWEDIRDLCKEVGPEGENYIKWVEWVEETGGDDPEKAVDLVMDLIGDNAASTNGSFLWIKDGLQDPLPSWGQQAKENTNPADTKQPWRS